MPNLPTQAGVFLPSYLNTCNSPGPSGQQDAYGNNYPTALTPGKVIELSPSEAQSLAAPGTTLYDGAYQFVLLDANATGANAVVGQPAYFRLDSGPTVGALPETLYANGSVTTYDQLTSDTALNLLAGVFLNPAALSGVTTAPTPGNYCFIFVGAGRAQCTVTSAAGTAVGDVVYPNGGSAGFSTVTAASVTAPELAASIGFAANPATVSSGVVAYCRNLIYRISNQGA